MIDLLKILQLLLIHLRSPASFIEVRGATSRPRSETRLQSEHEGVCAQEHSLDFAMHEMYKRKRWEQKPVVGQVAMQVLHLIERFR